MDSSIFTDWKLIASFVGILLSGGALPFLFKRLQNVPAADLPIVLPPSGTPEEFPDEPVKVVEETEPKEEKKAELPKEEKKAELPKAEKTAAPAKDFKSGGTVTGGISPAIVYLQNLKLQIEHFEKEIHQLRSQMLGFAQTHDKQFHALLEQMVAMHKTIHAELGAGHGTAPAPAVKPAPAPAVKPAPAPAVKPAPAPAVKPAPAPAAKPAPAPAAKPAPAPAAKPAPKPAAKSAFLDVELSPSVVEPRQGIELSLADEPNPPQKKEVFAPAPMPKVDVKSAETSSADAAALEIASTLEMRFSEDAPAAPAPAPRKKPPQDHGEDDILKTQGKGPVWPV